MEENGKNVNTNDNNNNNNNNKNGNEKKELNNKKVLGLFLIVVVIGVIFFVIGSKDDKRRKDEIENGFKDNTIVEPNTISENTMNGTTEEVEYSSKIKLGQKCWIQTNRQYDIDETERDTFTLTSDVRWEDPEERMRYMDEEELEESKEIGSKYDMMVDGINYPGYIGVTDPSKTDFNGNPKYTIEIVNIAPSGAVQVLINKK